MTKSFKTAGWIEDINLLSPEQRLVAANALIYACCELGCRAYHRRSKQDSPSDHQTICQHPDTRLNFLVISVVPSDSGAHRLRLDFFDHEEQVAHSGLLIERAPGTQWTLKGERRILVPDNTTLIDLIHLIGVIAKNASPSA